jgi:hypothetical protein
MIHDLPTLVRARRTSIEQEIRSLGRQNHRGPLRPSRAARLGARVLGQLGSLLVSIGRRLERQSVQSVRTPGGLSAAR